MEAGSCGQMFGKLLCRYIRACMASGSGMVQGEEDIQWLDHELPNLG